jgi:8-oxo-dGTP pyrophosphatase MutT (NUDIX family)
VIPDWLEPVRAAARDITADDLTRLVPPEDASPRRGAVLILFGRGRSGPDLLLTERAHRMRQHPGQVSFPGGALDDGEDAVTAALREATEETGLDAAGVEVFAELPELWLPPSNFAVTPVLAWWARPSPVSVVDPREVHQVFREPVSDLLDPDHRFSLRHPASGWTGPAFLIGDHKDVLLWGFTAGVVSRLFDKVGWTIPWDEGRIRDLPASMLQGGATRAATETSARAGVPPTSAEETR